MNDTQCCTGINGSHTSMCLAGLADDVLCWCCGVLFPVNGPHAMSAVWSTKGVHCSLCAPMMGGECGIVNTPCSARVGQTLVRDTNGSVVVESEDDFVVHRIEKLPERQPDTVLL